MEAAGRRRHKTLYNTYAVQHFINILHQFDMEHLEAPVAILRRLVVDSKFFCRQFVDYGGRGFVSVDAAGFDSVDRN